MRRRGAGSGRSADDVRLPPGGGGPRAESVATTLAALSPADRSRRTETRVRAILDGQRRRGPIGRWTTGAALALAVLAGGPLAVFQPVGGPELTAAPADRREESHRARGCTTSPRPTGQHSGTDRGRQNTESRAGEFGRCRWGRRDSRSDRWECPTRHHRRATGGARAAPARGASEEVERETARIRREADAIGRAVAQVRRETDAVDREAARVQRQGDAAETAARNAATEMRNVETEMRNALTGGAQRRDGDAKRRDRGSECIRSVPSCCAPQPPPPASVPPASAATACPPPPPPPHP